MALLKYLTPFFFLALLPLGEWLGGAWTFVGAAATPLALAGLDSVFGDDDSNPARVNGAAARWMPRIYVVLQLAVTGWAAAWVSRPSTDLVEAVGLTLSTGVTVGVFGFVAAHEMVHSKIRSERALGLALLGTLFYMHFRVAHVHGHHVRAATPDDPATARLGEGLYAFLGRSVAGQLREAWNFEAKRRRRVGGRILSLNNRMIAYAAAELLFLVFLAGLGMRVLAFVVAVAAIAVCLLETFNYVAHYGLIRRVVGGRSERLGPSHSWNSGRRMNNAALFNMGRHSDHHWHMTSSYQQLEPLPGEAKLPSGYAAALLMALVPPVWKRVMDPRAKAVRAAPVARPRIAIDQAGTP